MIAQALEAKLELAKPGAPRPWALFIKVAEDDCYWKLTLTNQQVDAMFSAAHAPVMRARAERSTPGIHANG